MVTINWERIKSWTILGLAVLCVILFSLRKCNTKDCPEITVGNVDTVRIDTVWADREVISHHWHKPVPKDSVYAPIDTVGVNMDSLCLALLNTLNYVRYYKDSVDTEDLTMWVEDSVRGTLLHKSVMYKLKIPREITITTKEYVYPTWDLYGGGFISKEGDKINFGPMLGLRHKNLYLSYSRGLEAPTNSLTVGIRFQVNKRKVKKNLFF